MRETSFAHSDLESAVPDGKEQRGPLFTDSLANYFAGHYVATIFLWLFVIFPFTSGSAFGMIVAIKISERLPIEARLSSERQPE